MSPRYGADGRLSFCFVLPTESLRWLVHDRLLRMYPALDYVLGWKDTRGFGLMMSECRVFPREGVIRWHDGRRTFA